MPGTYLTEISASNLTLVFTRHCIFQIVKFKNVDSKEILIMYLNLPGSFPIGTGSTLPHIKLEYFMYPMAQLLGVFRRLLSRIQPFVEDRVGFCSFRLCYETFK